MGKHAVVSRKQAYFHFSHQYWPLMRVSSIRPPRMRRLIFLDVHARHCFDMPHFVIVIIFLSVSRAFRYFEYFADILSMPASNASSSLLPPDDIRRHHGALYQAARRISLIRTVGSI